MKLEDLPYSRAFINREEQAVIFRLRTATGRGLMDCRNAYREYNSDFEAAKNHLIRTPIKKI